MWECNFAKEAIDYKLFWLRFAKKIWIIIDSMLGFLTLFYLLEKLESFKNSLTEMLKFATIQVR